MITIFNKTLQLKGIVMSNIYYTVEDEDGNSWDEDSKEKAMTLARQLEAEGHRCVHVFACRDDEDGEPEVVKTIY
jgi:hypothetical protein